MSTSRPRFSVTMTEEMYERINEFQHANKFPTQTKAINRILELGMAALNSSCEAESPQSDALAQSDRRALEMYFKLDSADRGEIRGEMKNMLKGEKYR